MKRLSVTQGEQFVVQDREERAFRQSLADILQYRNDLRAAEALIGQRLKKLIDGLVIHRDAHRFRLTDEQPLIEDVLIALPARSTATTRKAA